MKDFDSETENNFQCSCFIEQNMYNYKRDTKSWNTTSKVINYIITCKLCLFFNCYRSTTLDVYAYNLFVNN